MAAPASTTTTTGPPSLAGATAQAQALEVKILANTKRADILDERFLQARNAVRAAVKKVNATQKQIKQTEASVARLKRQLGGRAARLYMGAGSHDIIGMDVSSVQELGSRAKYGEAAAEQDLRVLDLLEITEAKLSTQKHDLDGQLAAARDRQDAVKDAQREVERANAAMQQLLDSTKDEIKVLATQMEQNSQAAATEAEKAWLKRQARIAERRKAGLGAPGAEDPGDYGPPGDLPARARAHGRPSSSRAEQLGKPYVYAGAGPDVWDCSGLTMVRVGTVGRVDGTRVAVAVQVVPARAHRPTAAGRSRLLRRHRTDEPPRRDRRRSGFDDRRAAHGCVRRARQLLPARPRSVRRATRLTDGYTDFRYCVSYSAARS